MDECVFCKLDRKDISNTIIEETNHFIVIPSKGSLCEGYLLIIPKTHILSMCELTDLQKDELIYLIDKYRTIFEKTYGRYPILFEHGSYADSIKNTSGSVIHAHMHIVNHNFLNENKVINNQNMVRVSLNEFLDYKKSNYISYISPAYEFYITYNFKPKSQQMRRYIADDLKISTRYNWKENNFEKNIINTINNFK